MLSTDTKLALIYMGASKLALTYSGASKLALTYTGASKLALTGEASFAFPTPLSKQALTLQLCQPQALGSNYVLFETF